MNDRATTSGQRASNGLGRPLGLGIILISLWYFPFAMHGELIGFQADDALYLLMADYYAPGVTPEPVTAYVHRVSQLAHGFPILLGLAGGGSAQVDIAHLVQTLCLVGSLALAAVLAARLWRDTRAALALLALGALAPATLLFSSEIWSEFTYLVFAHAALLAAIAATRSPRWWWAAAALCGCAAATRGVGLILVAALAASLCWRAPRSAWPALLLALLPVALAESYGLGGGSDYVDIFLRRNASPQDVMAGLAGNAQSIWAGWLGTFAVTPAPLQRLVGSAVLLLAIVGLGARLRAGALDGIYAAAYLGVLLAWPYPEWIFRLIYVLVPLLVIHAGIGARALVARSRPGLAGPAVLLVPLALLGCALPDSGRMAWKYLVDVPPHPAARASRHWLAVEDAAAAARDIGFKLAVIDFLRRAGAQVPEGECIHAQQPQAVMFHSRRISFPAPPAEAARARPACRYHLVLSDRRVRDAFRRVRQPYEVVLTARDAAGVAGVLVRYPPRP